MTYKTGNKLDGLFHLKELGTVQIPKTKQNRNDFAEFFKTLDVVQGNDVNLAMKYLTEAKQGGKEIVAPATYEVHKDNVKKLMRQTKRVLLQHRPVNAKEAGR